MVDADSKLVAQKRELEDRLKALRLAHAEAMQRTYEALAASQDVLRQFRQPRPVAPR